MTFNRDNALRTSRTNHFATALRTAARLFWSLPEPQDDADSAVHKADHALRRAALEYAESLGYQPPGQANLTDARIKELIEAARKGSEELDKQLRAVFLRL